MAAGLILDDPALEPQTAMQPPNPWGGRKAPPGAPPRCAAKYSSLHGQWRCELEDGHDAETPPAQRAHQSGKIRWTGFEASR